MERKHIPKINGTDDLGTKGKVGWYTEPCNYDHIHGDDTAPHIDVVFQCPNNHRAALTLHSVTTTGEVNASVLCWHRECGYHEFVILDEWPPTWSKKAGEHGIQK
jgi:hypothetical protein